MAESRRLNDEITVNDGKKLFDSEGLIDSLIVDTNDLVKAISCGQYVQFCNLIVHMVQKLSQLKNGIKNDMDNLKEDIVELKRLNDDLTEKAFDVPVDRGGDENVMEN